MMMAHAGNRGAARYGALELKQSYQVHLLWGLIVAAFLHVTMTGGVRLFDSAPIAVPERPPGPPETIIFEVDPHRPFYPETPPTIVTEPGPLGGSVPGDDGIPKPVPDETVKDEWLLLTIAQRASRYAVKTTGGQGEPGTGTRDGIQVEVLPERGAFVPHQHEPIAVHTVLPTYPELALASGLQAEVVVLALIDIKGLVRDAMVVRCTVVGMGFEEAALTAINQWRFKPALQNGHPVALWYKVPFRFRTE